MPTRRKKFIDKKNSVTFKLVHRSQKDPLVADESAPQHVLLDCEKQEAKSKRQAEQQKYGIYYDDDYNYLQHLKDVNMVSEWEPVEGSRHLEGANVETYQRERPRMSFPSSVFQSHVEESEGLLNKAAIGKGPKPDWDPDIVAALDDDFDLDNSENELEDDFISLANPPEDTCLYGEKIQDDDDSGDDSYDEHSKLSFGSEETKTLFTNYSMSSSVLPRSENLLDVDDHFEKFFEKYDDEEIGALDMDDIQGYLKPDSEIVQQLANEFVESQNQRSLKNIIMSRQRLQDSEIKETSDEELLDISVPKKLTEKWDCESIISTYSTTNNRPKLIEEPRKARKIEVSDTTGLPKGTLQVKGLTHHMVKNLDKDSSLLPNDIESIDRSTTGTTVRPKHETPEEKKQRKSTLKDIRRERRAEKKANKLAFKEEEMHQEKTLHNLRRNL